MTEFARFGGIWLLGTGVLAACSPEGSHRGLTEGGAAMVREASSEAIFAERYADLPRFLSGGLRCDLQQVEGQQGDVQKAVQRGSSGWRGGSPKWAEPSSIRVLSKQVTSDSTECSAPGFLCALLGPSKADRETHQLRRKMKESQEQHGPQVVRPTRTSDVPGSDSRVYLANDDSMSLASPQRVFWAIDRGAPFAPDWVRPHEMLNYFSFATLPVNAGEVFSVLPEISPHPMRSSDLTLGFSVRGRSVTKENRRNLNLTYVLDRSGSMAAEDRMDMLKAGVKKSFSELKPGDTVSILLFDTTTCPLAQNFVVGRDAMSDLVGLVDAISPRGGSNLQDGLGQGYAMADRAYRPASTSRVLLLTDAESMGTLADERLIEMSARNYDQRRVRLSAVGIGGSVSDALIDRITEAGKGASMFASSMAELDAIFGARFVSLVETVATNVHFKLELPDAVSLRAFYGEEASPKKHNVKSVHFFSGTKQMYLANLEKHRVLLPTDYIRLSIEFDDPETGEPRTSDFAWRADELEMATGEKSKFAQRNLNKARMVATFGYQLRYMAEIYGDLLQPQTSMVWSFGSEAFEQSRHRRQLEALNHCRRVKGRLDAFFALLHGEREAQRVADLWQQYCHRYEGAGPGLQLASPHPVLSEDPTTHQKLALSGRRNDYMPGPDDW